MRASAQPLGIVILVFALGVPSFAQSSSPTIGAPQDRLQPSVSAPFDSPAAFRDAGVPPAVELLRNFRDSGVKFDVAELMDMLRDRRHEGWVLAAYPDPKTHRPLIGAGVSLDLPARVHLQRDPLNPHPFLEPSSAELWQAAGLDPARLQRILAQFSMRPIALSRGRHRARIIQTLEPEITDEEATALLRVSVIQAAYNAQAYCRDFDRLTASQQMALTQLVYQMGVNLEEFSQFLQLINNGLATNSSPAAADTGYWSAVQESLIHSQWARLYRTRAVSVIAMLDPAYSVSPQAAERRVGATLRPAVAHRRRGRTAAPRELASTSTGRSRAFHGKKSRSRTKQPA
jgi:GH24 family phage-related lysozyme (muramidase)